MLSCPKVRIKHICGASGCVFNTIPINIQADEVLTNDASSENVRSIDVLTFFISSQHGEKQKEILLSLQNARTQCHTQTETLRYTEMKQQRLRCGLRSSWSVIKFWGSKPDLLMKLNFRECCGVVPKVADNTSSCLSVRSFQQREKSKEKRHVLQIAVGASNFSRTKAIWIAILKIIILSNQFAPTKNKTPQILYENHAKQQICKKKKKAKMTHISYGNHVFGKN